MESLQTKLSSDLLESKDFVDGIRNHFDRLPTRYALDVNIDSLDVLSHKRLLEEARADPSAVSFAVRPVEILVPKHGKEGETSPRQARDSLLPPLPPHAFLTHPIINFARDSLAASQPSGRGSLQSACKA